MHGKNQKISGRIGLVWTMIAGVLALSSAALAQPNPNSPTTQWVPILYGNNIAGDLSSDQQNGGAELDVVGNQSEPSFYLQYSSGYLGFRLRLGADKNPPGFGGCAFVGLDVNRNGALDLFVGVNNQGNRDQIGIWQPGPGANTSPGTTSVGTLFQTYAETSLTYDFTPITPALDPTASNFDLNGDGNTDQFLTFYVPLTDVTAALAARNMTFTASSLTDLMAITATQPNNLNGDINDVNGGIGSSSSWTQLGALSQAYAPVSIISVPEPSAATFFGLAMIVTVCHLLGSTRRY
ncbi:MAG TPA: hypothetical protein VKS19_05425 [Verrucomicrobiae bacterium]|nr:hypothetical protein [Verrucomicrobiae bacterium]